MSAIPSPAAIRSLFVTEVYQTEFGGTALDPLIVRLDAACRKLATEDQRGREWARRQGYLGYTSYDTVEDLPAHAPVFAELRDVLDVHALLYARLLEMDLRGGSPKMQRCWINVLSPGGAHSGHVHPHSIISGTLYIALPAGAGALQFEDPRHVQMMHAPLRLPGARPDRLSRVAMGPVRGSLLLWESWLRHEVPTNLASEDRISISFNYDL